MEDVMMIDIDNLTITSQPITEATDMEKDGLRGSIEDIGLLYPLLVRAYGDGKKYEVLDGRTRYEVLKKIGYKAVKCIVRSNDVVKNESLPYDCEIFRRHLNKTQVGHFTKVRNERKAEAEASYVKSMLDRLPEKLRKEAEEYIYSLSSDGSKRRQVDVLAECSPSELRDFLDTLTYKHHCGRLQQEIAEIKKEKKSLAEKLEDAEDNKEKEVKARLAKFSEEVEKRIKEIEERGFVLPEDPEEKTLALKKIEKSVAERFNEEIAQSHNNIKEMKNNYLKLQKLLDDKSDEIEKLKQSKKELQVDLDKADNMVETYTDMLVKQTDVVRVKKRFRDITNDLERLNELLIERQFIADEIGNEDKKELLSFLTGIKKVLGETESAIKEI